MRFARFVPFLLAVIWSFLLISCAATRDEVMREQQKDQEKQKVDELLDKKQQGQAQEDDVLKLLGIESGEKTDEKAGKPVRPEKAAMETQVTQLESQLQTKEQEIQKLRTELEDKNKKLNELENVLNELKSAPAQPAISMRSSAKISLEEYRQRYEAALNEYKRRNYNAAIRAFQELLQIDSGNSYSDNCQYWIGECYYGLMMYEQALTEFEKVFAFVNSNKEDDAQLKIALCYMNLNRKDQAKNALEKLISKYPKSEYLAKARQLLQNL